MNDEAAIRRLMARYCHTLDDGAFEEFGDLWAEDADFVLQDVVTTGRAAIRDAIATSQPPERRGRHMTVNMEIDVDGDTARALSDFMFWAKHPERGLVTRFVGRYVDEFVRTEGGWRIRRREIRFL